MGATFFAAFVAFAVGIVCFSTIIYIIEVIGIFKSFEKMGLEGWKAIIPFYNAYLYGEKVWTANYGLFVWVVYAVNILVISRIAQTGGFIGGLFGIIGFVATVIFVVGRARFCYWTSKSFGYEIPFAVGLFFLPFVFHLIIGFGDAKYRGNVFLESGSQY